MMKAMDAVETYNALTDEVDRVCNCVRKNVHHCGGEEKPEGCPLDGGSYYVVRHGAVYPTHGWEIMTRPEAKDSIVDNAMVVVQAWNGSGGDDEDNSEFWFPFKWLDLADDEIVEALKGELRNDCRN